MENEKLLFPVKDMYLMEHTSNGRSRTFANMPIKRRRKMIHENMHLMDGMKFTTTGLHCPQLAP